MQITYTTKRGGVKPLTALYIIRWRGMTMRVRATHAEALALAGLLLTRRRAA